MDNDGAHVPFSLVEEKLVDGQFFAYLADGESAWNPASTKRPIWGPAKLTYTKHPDGAWNVLVEDA